MNIFVIPSWYPSRDVPSAGIFFKEQAELYAKHFPEDRLGIVHWGQNDDRLLLASSDFWKIPSKMIRGNGIDPSTQVSNKNLITYFKPTYTWSRRLMQGNIEQIIRSGELALIEFSKSFGKPEIIHAHVGYPGGYVAWKLAEKFAIPFMITEHMGPFPFPSFTSGDGDLSKWLKGPLENAGLILAVSDHLRRQMSGYGLNSDVFYNFIDDAYFRYESPKPHSNKSKLIHIGRLVPEKRQEDLFHAVRLLPDSLDFELNIIGEGPLRSHLDRVVKNLGLERKVFFQGEVGRSGVREAIRNSDFMVLSSNYENFPVSILEALACGKPVVATRCGGPEEMINSINGLLANPEDPRDLSDKIASLLSKVDQYSWTEIRNDFDDRFGSNKSVQRLKEIYNQVISNYKS